MYKANAYPRILNSKKYGLIQSAPYLEVSVDLDQTPDRSIGIFVISTQTDDVYFLHDLFPEFFNLRENDTIAVIHLLVDALAVGVVGHDPDHADFVDSELIYYRDIVERIDSDFTLEIEVYDNTYGFVEAYSAFIRPQYEMHADWEFVSPNATTSCRGHMRVNLTSGIVESYDDYVTDTHPEFEPPDPPIGIDACSSRALRFHRQPRIKPFLDFFKFSASTPQLT